MPLAAEKTVTENGVRAFGWKYDKSYTRISTNDVATIQAYAKKGGKYLIKLQPKADGGKNLYCGQRIDVSNHTELVIVSESTNISLCVKSTMSKDPNTYSDMFRVEKGSSLTLGDNEKNGKHGVILDGRGTAHMGRLVCVEVGGSLNIYPRINDLSIGQCLAVDQIFCTFGADNDTEIVFRKSHHGSNGIV